MQRTQSPPGICQTLPQTFTRSAFEIRFSQARHAQRAHEGREIARIADQLVDFLRHALDALTPVIGEKSVSALYKHSVVLTRSKHPWLSAAYGDLPHSEVLTHLQSSVLRQTLRNAQSAVSDLVQMFKELLHTLIGSSLCQRLMGPSASSSEAF